MRIAVKTLSGDRIIFDSYDVKEIHFYDNNMTMEVYVSKDSEDRLKDMWKQMKKDVE